MSSLLFKWLFGPALTLPSAALSCCCKGVVIESLGSSTPRSTSLIARSSFIYHNAAFLPRSISSSIHDT